jgi:ATP synthase I subunit
MTDVDPFFRRMTWSAVLFCLGAAGLALLLTGNWRVAAGVLGGGALVGVSLLAIRSSVDAMIAVMTAGDPDDKARAQRRARGAVFRLVGRYALLAAMAYVMIARLRLHPIGLLIGASSLVASAALEAGRVLTRMRVS